MLNSAIFKFLELKDPALFEGNLALLCNQVSFDFNSGKYLFDLLNNRGVLKKIFIPEHGLFAEFQDQVKLDQTEIYRFLNLNAKFISLYGKTESSLNLKKEDLSSVDTFVIDIQDAGSRYYTYLSTIKNLFISIKKHRLSIKVYVIDRPNPADRQVEGSLLPEKYASFIGITGLPHRYGLTLGELCKFFRSEMNAGFDLEVIPFNTEDFFAPFPVSPSPNFPTLTTAQIYSGQCLFEGSILSEGRGTTKPFEIIGAPFLKWDVLLKIQEDLFKNYPFFKDKIMLRPLKFIPTDHKFKGEVCNGFQLHILDPSFHVLIFSLILLKYIDNYTDKDIWKKGKYEYGSDKTAIELLAGDDKILKYLKQSYDLKSLILHLQKEEDLWIKKVRNHLIYPFDLFIQRIPEKNFG